MKAYFVLASLCILTLAACSTAPSDPTLSSVEQEGQRLFQQTCSACHTTSGTTVIVGPPLAGIASRADTRVAGLDARGYLEQSILDPSAYVNEGFGDLMPKNFGQVFTPEQIQSLVAFLLTLR